MSIIYHYPPEITFLLIDVIPLLCRSKKDVTLFFRGAGVSKSVVDRVDDLLLSDPKSINKYEIARKIINHVNEGGDNTLRQRREVLKRVIEFEDFSTCWPDDQLKAKGLVAEVRRVQNVKDSFIRMKQERDSEKSESQKIKQIERDNLLAKKKQIESLRDRLYSLFSEDQNPQKRGKNLELILNELFRVYGISVNEDFKRRDPESGTVLEQIDGVISLDNLIYLVEMKWLKEPVGIADFAPHLVRLFARANAYGIFISNSGFTEPVLKECKNALNNKIMILCSLEEIVFLLHEGYDLIDFLRKKIKAATIDKNPFLKITSII